MPRSILDNSTVITSIGFFTGALDQSSQYGIFLPRVGDYRVPDTWAELTFSVPVPETTLATTTTATTLVTSRISATTTVPMSTTALIVTATVTTTKLESPSTSQVLDYTWTTALSIVAILIVVILAVVLLRRRPRPSGAAVGAPKPVLPTQERDSRYVEYLAKLEDLRTRGEISEETYLKLKDEYWEKFKR